MTVLGRDMIWGLEEGSSTQICADDLMIEEGFPELDLPCSYHRKTQGEITPVLRCCDQRIILSCTDWSSLQAWELFKGGGCVRSV